MTLKEFTSVSCASSHQRRGKGMELGIKALPLLFVFFFIIDVILQYTRSNPIAKLEEVEVE